MESNGDAAPSSSSNNNNNVSATFRAKVLQMKSWKPTSTPSNRDRLELYALHKQAVSGDAPLKDPPTTTGSESTSVAEKAKLAAWRTKRSLSQHDAMTAYNAEADRQVRVYGTVGSRESAPTTSSTPATVTEDDASSFVLLTPRGLAAIPLLCAAAAETRPAYLSRLATTGPPSNGWWKKQEPLCVDPGTLLLGIPERLVIFFGTLVESASLTIGVTDRLPFGAGVVQSVLWPLHNVLLSVWMLVIFVSTLLGSAFMTTKTILLGSKRTGATLEDIFSEEIVPCKDGVGSLCEPHQSVAVRMVGLFLYPIGLMCDSALTARDVTPGGSRGSSGNLVGGGVHLLVFAFTWWYWLIVMPWVAFFGIGIAANIGWCFGLIELAGIA